jgi:hypothetical protein
MERENGLRVCLHGPSASPIRDEPEGRLWGIETTDFHQFMLYTPVPGTPLSARITIAVI